MERSAEAMLDENSRLIEDLKREKMARARAQVDLARLTEQHKTYRMESENPKPQTPNPKPQTPNPKTPS